MFFGPCTLPFPSHTPPLHSFSTPCTLLPQAHHTGAAQRVATAPPTPLSFLHLRCAVYGQYLESAGAARGGTVPSGAAGVGERGRGPGRGVEGLGGGDFGGVLVGKVVGTTLLPSLRWRLVLVTVGVGSGWYSGSSRCVLCFLVTGFALGDLDGKVLRFTPDRSSHLNFK